MKKNISLGSVANDKNYYIYLLVLENPKLREYFERYTMTYYNELEKIEKIKKEKIKSVEPNLDYIMELDKKLQQTGIKTNIPELAKASITNQVLYLSFGSVSFNEIYIYGSEQIFIDKYIEENKNANANVKLISPAEEKYSNEVQAFNKSMNKVEKKLNRNPNNKIALDKKEKIYDKFITLDGFKKRAEFFEQLNFEKASLIYSLKESLEQVRKEFANFYTRKSMIEKKCSDLRLIVPQIIYSKEEGTEILNEFTKTILSIDENNIDIVSKYSNQKIETYLHFEPTLVDLFVDFNYEYFFDYIFNFQEGQKLKIKK